ncbi:MAG: glycosyltransferase family 2 protein [Patescibacteria group bacterium]|nr:glycosyltransferase family 2 protein [Patescibacteria group bacterium]
MQVVAVVPAYNESQVIGAAIGGLRPFVNDVVVVDDGSADRTGECARQAGAVVLRHFINRGQGAAIFTGIRYALELGADYIVTFDADGQHRAEEVSKLIEPLLLGRFDVALGSRFLEQGRVNMPVSRRWLLKLAVRFDRLRTGLRITDTHNGLRAFSRQAAEKIHLTQDRMAHASQILDEIARLQLRYVEVPVKVQYTVYTRVKGQPGFFGSLRILRDLLLSRMFR